MSARTPLERIRHALHSNLALAPFLVLVLTLAAFLLVNGPSFLSPFSLSLVLQQVAIVGVVGAAQTLVVLTAVLGVLPWLLLDMTGPAVRLLLGVAS